MSDSNVFTVLDLKNKLKVLGLPIAGTKAELIARLMKNDLSGAWMVERSESDDSVETVAGTERLGRREDVVRRLEIDCYRQEKELAERELELTRREIAVLRGERRGSFADCNGGAGAVARDAEMAEVPHRRIRMQLTTVADLLSEFDSTGFDTWKKQLRFLKATYWRMIMPRF